MCQRLSTFYLLEVGGTGKWEAFYDKTYKSTYAEAKKKCSAIGAKMVDGFNIANEVRFGCHIIDLTHYHFRL